MLPFPFVKRFVPVFAAPAPELGRRRRRFGMGFHGALELLEARALLAAVTVHVVNFAFNPTNPTIHVNDTIHWVFDTSNHSTTSVKGIAESWDSGILNAGATFDHTFTHAGTFAYYCTVHGSD